MATSKVSFQTFLDTVEPQYRPFVAEQHTLLEDTCICIIKEAKSGYVLSYIHGRTGRVLANYVFRKQGLALRVYADHIAQDMDILEALPESMCLSMERAPDCKRLLDPQACNAKCPMGYTFLLMGNIQQKCRNNCFFFFLRDETMPHLRKLLAREVAARSAGEK